MKTFEFTLKFSLPENGTGPKSYIEHLGAAGCDDALIGVGKTGRIVLNFDREASSALKAVSSAISDVKRAIPGCQLVEAAPDLVGLTDIANIAQCSRQYMRKLMLDSKSGFPAPIYEGKSVLWRLSKVLIWLRDDKKYQFDSTLLDVAKTNMQFNVAKEAQDIDAEIKKNIYKLVS
ncbi:helix-turn-helix transcriptional regulator [Porticoccus sp. GXU_MW_L64]